MLLQYNLPTKEKRKRSTKLKTDDCEEKNPVDCKWLVLQEVGDAKTTFELVVKDHTSKKYISCSINA